MLSHRHFILLKPHGYLSQFIYTSTRRKNKGLLGELYDFPEGTMAIGRLDQDSEGLIFLTTDGKVSHAVRSKKIEKEYYVQLDGLITDKALDKLQNGIEITVEGEKYFTLPGKVFKLEEIPDLPPRGKPVRDDRHGPTVWVSITITEGKNRQVRKMTAASGFPTLRLFRARIGNTTWENLNPGGVIEVEKFDI
jgi:23S rRNA pseudouridine2457 synthase